MHLNPYQSPPLPTGATANNPFTIVLIVVWMLLALPLGAAVALVVALVGLMFSLEMSSGIKELVCCLIGLLAGLSVMTGCWYSGFRWFHYLLTPDH